MHARVWQPDVSPGKVQDFHDILSSLVELARQQEGYRGVLALGSGKSEAPDVTLIGLRDSLEAIRASEDNLFLTKETTRFLTCCEGFRHIKSCSQAISTQPAITPRREVRQRLVKTCGWFVKHPAKMLRRSADANH